jgi:hypothetical protein
MSQSAHKSILPRDWKLGFQPDSAGELPACRALRHAGTMSSETGKDAYPPGVSSETGKDAYPPDAITRSIFHVPHHRI